MLDPGTNFDDLVVSIPKEEIVAEDSLVVSISLSKLEDKKRLKFFSIPKLKAPNASVVPAQHPQVGGIPGQGPFHFMPSQTPVLNSIPQQNFSVVPSQSLPVPLFPRKDPPVAPFAVPRLGPSPSMPPPGVIPPPTAPPIGDTAPRKALLPTPPANMKLLPDDFKQLKAQEYWESQAAVGKSASSAPSPPHQATPNEATPFPAPQFKVQENTQYRGPSLQYPVLSNQQSPQTVHQAPQHQSPQPPPQQLPPQQHQSPPQQHHLQLPPSNQPAQFKGHHSPGPNPAASPNQQFAPAARMEQRPGPRMDPRQHNRLNNSSEPWNHPASSSDHAFAGPDRQFSRNQPTHYAESARLPPGLSPGFPQEAEQRHVQAPPPLSEKVSPIWGRSPEQSTANHHGGIRGMAPMGGVGREGEGRRVDPRTKYSHLKIKPKGSSSPGQQSSPSLKRAHPDDPSTSSFKTPKLLQEPPQLLDQPMDPHDLFKSGAESGYEEAATFGMFKSNFFSRSQPHPQEGAGPGGTKQHFGEIMLEGAASNQAPRSSGGSGGSDASTDEVPSESPIPSYLAQLDVGLGDDGGLKIDSAFGSLGKTQPSLDDKTGGEESQARKLPTMFGFGF